jgi:F0F1-type ATP synthase epsilon subunit
MAQPAVEFEFERDGETVVLAVRCAACNFVLTIPLDGATVFAAAALRAADESTSAARYRFQLARANLEVSNHEKPSPIQ